MKTHWANKIRASTVIWKSARSVWNLMIILMELTETSQQAGLILSHQKHSCQGQNGRRKHGTKPKTQVLVGWPRSRTTTWNPHGPCDRPQRMIFNANTTKSNWWNWLRELWDPAQGWFAFVGQILDGFELIFTPLKMKKKSKCTT